MPISYWKCEKLEKVEDKMKKIHFFHPDFLLNVFGSHDGKTPKVWKQPQSAYVQIPPDRSILFPVSEVGGGTKRPLASQRTITISLTVRPGLWNLLAFLSVGSQALWISVGPRHFYFYGGTPRREERGGTTRRSLRQSGGQMSFFSTGHCN